MPALEYIDGLPTSRGAAKACGSSHYFTGSACTHGHIDRRYTVDGACFTCAAGKRKRQRAAAPRQYYDKARARANVWYRENTARHRANSAQWAKENPERMRIIRTASSNKRRARLLGQTETATRQEVEDHRRSYGKACAACRKRGKMTLDHIIPLAKGGAHAVRNFQWLCLSCNSAKCDRDPIDFARRQGRLL